MYSNIVVGLDSSKESWKALDHAIAISKLFKSKILVVSVLPFAADADVKKQFLLARKQFLEAQKKALSICKTHGVAVKSLLLEGEAGEELLDASKAAKADLIVIGRLRDTVYGRFLFARVSYYLVERARIPILIVK